MADRIRLMSKHPWTQIGWQPSEQRPIDLNDVSALSKVLFGHLPSSSRRPYILVVFAPLLCIVTNHIS